MNDSRSGIRIPPRHQTRDLRALPGMRWAHTWRVGAVRLGRLSRTTVLSRRPCYQEGLSRRLWHRRRVAVRDPGAPTTTGNEVDGGAAIRLHGKVPGLRQSGDARQHRVAGRAPGRSRPRRSGVRRGRAAVRDRPHPRRGEAGLAHRAERPRDPRLRRRRGLCAADVSQGHQPGHDACLVRRPEQLVGGLRAVGVHAIRAPRCPPAGRRPG